jgi:hypothetical protein
MQGFQYNAARKQYYDDGLGWNPLPAIGRFFTGGGNPSGGAPTGGSILLRPTGGEIINRAIIPNSSGGFWNNNFQNILNAGVGLTSQWLASRGQRPTQQVVLAPTPVPSGAPAAGEASGGGNGGGRGDNSISLSERDGVRGQLNITPQMIWLGIGAIVVVVLLTRGKK